MRYSVNRIYYQVPEKLTLGARDRTSAVYVRLVEAGCVHAPDEDLTPPPGLFGPVPRLGRLVLGAEGRRAAQEVVRGWVGTLAHGSELTERDLSVSVRVEHLRGDMKRERMKIASKSKRQKSDAYLYHFVYDLVAHDLSHADEAVAKLGDADVAVLVEVEECERALDRLVRRCVVAVVLLCVLLRPR